MALVPMTASNATAAVGRQAAAAGVAVPARPTVYENYGWYQYQSQCAFAGGDLIDAGYITSFYCQPHDGGFLLYGWVPDF